MDRVKRARSRGDARGFTLVEVLTVVAILVLLFTLVMVASSRVLKTRDTRTTVALIQRLRYGLEEYNSLMGKYPPDGYDSEVINDDGIRIWGSACLYYFLTKELTVSEEISGQIRTSKHDPILKFSSNELLEDLENDGVFEIRDGFGLPFHYDNTENQVFNPDSQMELAHMYPEDNHPEDPRTNEKIVHKVGIQRVGYDLWSHGTSSAHRDPNVDVTLTIGTWNVDVEETQRAAKEEE